MKGQKTGMDERMTRAFEALRRYRAEKAKYGFPGQPPAPAPKGPPPKPRVLSKAGHLALSRNLQVPANPAIKPGKPSSPSFQVPKKPETLQERRAMELERQIKIAGGPQVAPKAPVHVPDSVARIREFERLQKLTQAPEPAPKPVPKQVPSVTAQVLRSIPAVQPPAPEPEAPRFPQRPTLARALEPQATAKRAVPGPVPKAIPKRPPCNCRRKR